MELKSGYKQTEVGMIPEDWEVISLSQAAKRITRGASPRPIDSPIWFDSRSSVGWVRISDVTNSGRYLKETTQRLSEAGIRRSRPVPSGSLIMSICATVGRPIETRIDTCIHDGFVVFDQPSIDQSYLYHLLAALEPTWSKHGQTGSQMNLNTGLINGCLIPLPPTEDEQRAIASALSDVDALLEGFDRLIAKKRELKQAAMQQLLTGETRLPGFEGEWEKTELGQLVTFLSGGTPSRSNESYWNGDVPWISATSLRTFYIWRSESNVTKEAVAAGSKMAPVGATLLLVRGSALHNEILAGLVTKPVCFNQDVKALLPKTTVFPKFLTFLLHGKASDLLKLVSSAGNTAGVLDTKILKAFEVWLPQRAEQEAISRVLTDMDAEITALEQRRAKTKDLKQAMMQELLTGRIRLIQPCESVAQEVSKSTDAKPHSWAFNEAVVISTLAKHFGKEDFPLGRKRYTKLSYLLHRHAERQAEGYLKKAAGPYNPKTKYGGPERIALGNGYIREHKNGRFSGFVAADNIAQAEEYFEKWYGPDAVRWLSQFRFKTNDDLEVLATVDMAAEELRTSGKIVDVTSVKEVIHRHPEWKAKLDREAFSDTNIANGIKQNHILFNSDTAGGPDD